MTCPFKYKWELVDWLTTYHNWDKATANQLTKKQCYAIWYNKLPLRHK